MRPLLLMLTVVCLSAADAVPAPATVTATDGAGPSASARLTEHSLAVDTAWAAARKRAEMQAQARQAAATKASGLAAASRGVETQPAPLTPGGLATLAGQDEVAMVLELQRRRRGLAGGSLGDLLAAELAAVLVGTTAHLPSIDRTPDETGSTAHPGDGPHPGPRAPVPVDAPDRPEQFPTR